MKARSVLAIAALGVVFSSVARGDDTPPPVGACCHPDISAKCTADTESACNAAGSVWQGAGTTCDGAACPVVPTPYVDALPSLPVATPVTGDAGAAAHYRIFMRTGKAKFHRDLPETDFWGFDDGVSGPVTPGPTFEARSGEPIEVTWVNDLRDLAGNLLTKHALAVDQCLPGASTDSPRTVVHLHGGHVPSKYDGQPGLTLLPGDETAYDYPNKQGAATLWYHDDSLGITRLNVMMGLAGFYILRDDDEAGVPLPARKYEIPIIIQDRSFSPDGQLRYPAKWTEQFFGDTAVVNGKVWPFLKVDRGLYRFRLLNGSGSRTYTLALSTSEAFRQIGTDGGLLDHPVALNELTIAPGERADIVVDFGSHEEGDEIVLTNSAPAPFPIGEAGHALPSVMKFVVGANAGFGVAPPVHLRTIETFSEKNAAQIRDFVLDRRSDACAGARWMINGRHSEDITERPVLGTTEIWRFFNRSDLMHPMHLHLAMFHVLDRQPIAHGDDAGVPSRDDAGVPASDPIPVTGAEVGWKDTVQVMPFQMVRVIVKFEDFAGRFPYNCQILERDDNEMTRNLETVSICGDGITTDDEGCDDGNTKSGDGCTADCKVEPPMPINATPRAPPAPWKGDGCACRLSHRRPPAPGAAGPVAILLLLGGLRRRGRTPHPVATLSRSSP